MHHTKTKWISASLLLATLLIPHTIFSSMQSSNYEVQFDSINIGGIDSSSASFQLRDTVGEVGSGDSSSATYQMRAGYQQMNSAYIAINGQTPLDLGNTGGISVNNVASSTVVNVVTDSYGGYQLTVRSTSSPTLTSGSYFFSDYTPSGVVPDYTFSVGSTDSAFGFAVEGADVIQKYRNNGSACNAGSSSTAMTCWDGLSTTPALVAQKNSSNHPTGSDTTFHYQIGIGADKIQEAGTYTGELVITATAL